MLETNLIGTPKTAQDNYHNFSTYSYSDENNGNVKFYQNYAVRAYIEPRAKYRFKKYYRTLYENNSTDIVGFLAALELAGNENFGMKLVLQPEYTQCENRNTQTTWNEINKDDLMDWINKQTEKSVEQYKGSAPLTPPYIRVSYTKRFNNDTYRL